MNTQFHDIIFRKMMEHPMVGSYVWQNDAFVYISKSLADVVGYKRDELCHKENILNLLIDPDDFKRVHDVVSGRPEEKGWDDTFQVEVIHKNGIKIYLEVFTARTFYEGKPAVIGITFDVSDKIKIQKSLEQSEQQFRSLFEHNLDSVFSFDLEGRFTNINPACEKTTGYTSSELIGNLFMPLVVPADLPKAIEAYELAKSGCPQRTNVTIFHKKGYEILLDINVMPIVVKHEITGVFSIARDITNDKRAEKTLKQLSYFDPITTLPNRKNFLNILNERLPEAKKHNRQMALLYINQNRTRVVNEWFGHSAGDKFLKMSAQRLQAYLGNEAELASVGGDEFCILLSNVHDLESLKNTANQILEIYQKPFYFDNQEFRTGINIGISIYPTHAKTGEELIRNAEAALKEAKNIGKNYYKFYTPLMTNQTNSQVTIENALFGALERNEFSLHYQPRIEVNTGKVIGTEALLRWQNPALGSIPPASFIPFAEELGLIVPIGKWVLKEACRQNKEWQDAGYNPIRVAVNVSARQFQRSDIVETIRRILQETGLEARWLEIEITEGTLMQDEETNIQTLKNIAELGVNVSIDDFGTGYSSLSYLKRFEINTLKIDRSFVKNIDTNTENEKITKAVIHLAHSLNMKVVSEGVETNEEFNMLKSLCTDEIQGYLISKPVPSEDHIKFLNI